MNQRSILQAAGLLGVTGVALGAFGAHALHETLLQRGMLEAWETAVRYHLLHAVALLALAGFTRSGESLPGVLGWTAKLWIVGAVLFAGSLYGIALGGPRWLGPVTPLGGLALILGWGSLTLVGAKKKE
jgi:uncharacterized membrane protein YgdD (TMEM256/DUF423 family)